MRVTEPIRIANERRNGVCEIPNDSFSDYASEAQTRIRRQMRLYPRTAGRIARGCLLCPKRFNHHTGAAHSAREGHHKRARVASSDRRPLYRREWSALIRTGVPLWMWAVMYVD